MIKNHHDIIFYNDAAYDVEKGEKIIAAIEKLTRKHDNMMKNDIMKAFKKFDLNNSGTIDSVELQALSKSLG